MLTCDIYYRTKEQAAKSLFTPLLARADNILVREKVIKKKNHYRIELAFVGEKIMRKLNVRYRKKNKPTDVLSLSFFHSEHADYFAGEIFICPSVAKKQAKKLGHSFFEELRFLFVHGFLHLFGFDHEKPKEEKKMSKLTEEILEG